MKKTLILALIFLISLSIVNAVETAISYEELRFDLVRTDPSPLSAGGSFDIWFDITNIQSYNIRNVQISLVDKFPFNISTSRLATSPGFTLSGVKRTLVAPTTTLVVLISKLKFLLTIAPNLSE